MGVADNKTYKDMYHFNAGFYGNLKLEDAPSITFDPKINDSIKENPYLSNVEIEGDELVLEPDLTALFKARGKKHSQGGMNVNLKSDSFIFSDDKVLAFDENDHKLFEFKEGGSFSKDKNTPADVLKRQIDPKHYNKMMAILEDPKKDTLAKKSAAMMMEKYIQTLGNVAYLQEQKKGFPTGIPDFAQGSAPVYDPTIKDEIMSQKQFMKYGGSINPYMDKGGKWGLWKGDKTSNFQDIYGTTNAADKIDDLDKLATRLGYTGPKDNESFQRWLYNSSSENKSIIDKWHKAYNNGPINGMFDGKLGIRWQDAIKEITRGKGETVPTYNKPKITAPNFTIPTTSQTPSIYEAPIKPGDVEGTPQTGKEINWQFTPWQRISQAYNASKYAGLNRYMPARTHINAGYVDPYLVNPEQTVGDMKAQTNSQIGALSSLSPILRNAQAGSAYGEFLNRTPGVRSQYDNQNAGIINQSRQYNNQIENNTRAMNAQNDQNYYQQSVAGRQNFDNMKTYLGDQFMNNVLGDVQTNQSLAYNLASMKNPAYGFDFKTGNFIRNPKNILDVQGTGSMDEYRSAMQYINSITDPAKKADAYIKLLGVKSMGSAINQTGKKGGKFRGTK